MKLLLTSAQFEVNRGGIFKHVFWNNPKTILEEYYLPKLKEAGIKVLGWEKDPRHGKYPFIEISSFEDLQKLVKVVDNPIVILPNNEGIIIYDGWLEY